MQILKEVLFLYFALVDALLTIRKIYQYGTQIELNPWIRRLCANYSVVVGVLLGVGIPTAILAVVGWFYPNVLSFLLGMRFCLYLLQKVAGGK